MTGKLLLLGLNHTTAPLEVREKLAFGAAQQQEAVAEFRRRFDGCEAVLLSTCNRVELYAARADGHPQVDELVDFLASLRSVPAETFRSCLYHKHDRGAVEHLFNVACSLDSMVLGETQIIGQVREAYELARREGAAGALLHPLFQRALAVGKQVMHETPLGEGRLSIASVAVDHAGRIFDHYHDKTVLCIGAGKMAELVLRSFAQLAPRRLLVCNRDYARAEALAGRHRGEAAAMERLDDHLIAADIVISSTGSDRPIITAERFEKLLGRRRYRTIFLIDIALPRDIEPQVGRLENVYLYNLDDLQQVVSQTQSQRREAIEAARAVVTAQVEQFTAWDRTRELGPVIDRLYRRYHQLAQEELARTLNKLPNVSEEEKAHLEELTRRIVNKLLHDPVAALHRGESPHAQMAQYLHALEKLFHLDTPSPARPDESRPPEHLRPGDDQA